MKFISLKSLAISPMAVELYVNIDKKLCVRCTYDHETFCSEVVESDGVMGVYL